jgi:acyl-CoA reductase-like NAD-dependent aldehyde dehydrogenase
VPEGRVNVAGVEVSTDHYIDGRRVASMDRFLDRSPVDGSALAEVSAGGAAEAEMAVDAARRAFPAWAALGPEGRAPILRRFAEGIQARAAELAAVETLDNGSLLTGNTHRVVPRAAQNISYFAEHALTLGGHTIDSPEVVNHVRYDPAGVAALVTPWNAPLMLTTWKVGPALAAGNTVVVKPPEWAPLTCSLMADVAEAAGVPAGVLNVVQGIGEDAGAALTQHADINRISFTGSTDTARIIGQAAARSITSMSAELGGKSPFIVCAGADLKAAAQTVAGQYVNAGQVCLAGTRVLVEETARRASRSCGAASAITRANSISSRP